MVADRDVIFRHMLDRTVGGEPRIVGDHLLEVDSDALHLDSDQLGVEEGALEESALIEPDEGRASAGIPAGLADPGQDLARDPFSEALRPGAAARGSGRTAPKVHWSM